MDCALKRKAETEAAEKAAEAEQANTNEPEDLAAQLAAAAAE